MTRVIICKCCGAKNMISSASIVFSGERAIKGKICKECGERLDNFCNGCGRSTMDKKGRYATEPQNRFFICNKCEKIWCSDCMSALLGIPRKKLVISGKKGNVSCPKCSQRVSMVSLPKTVLFSQVSKKEKEKIREVMKEEKKEEKKKPYRLVVTWKGKQDVKKVSFGIKMFSVGTEFGGGEYEKLILKCGKCKKADRFRIVDNENYIFECVNCGALNQPDNKGKKFLE